MLSKEGINQAILGKDVEQKATDCLQDWAAACSSAVKELMEKDKQLQAANEARERFVIGLVGNLAWAATVFFPAAAVVAASGDYFGASGYVYSSGKALEGLEPAAATKIVSVLGATVGSGTISELAAPTASFDWTAIEHHLGEMVPKIADSLAQAANGWRDSYLVNHMVATFSLKTKPDANRSNDGDFRDWCNSYEGGRELRKVVWEKFVFPADGISYSGGQEGLKIFLLRKLTDLKTRYDTELKNYQLMVSTAYMAYASGFHNPFTKLAFDDWKRRRAPQFHFVANVDGLPAEFLKAQDLRSREAEFRLDKISRSDPATVERIPVPGAGLPRR